MLAVKQERNMTLCEWLGGSGALIEAVLTYDDLRICLLETGDAVMAADGKITRPRIANDVFVANRKWPVGDEQALYSMWLDYCQEVLQLREEFVSDSGDLGEGKFLSGSLVGKLRVR